jgi:hypothetical protein
MDHCCKKRQYFFEIKKCGEVECTICKPIRSDPEIFKELKGLPDPIPEPDNHYKPFSEVYNTDTTEMYCPSLQNRKSQNIPKKAEKRSGNGMDFSPTAQFAKNVRTVVKCVECNKSRVLYARRKISDEQYQLLQIFIDSIEYSCGVSFKDISDLSSLARIAEQNRLNNNKGVVDLESEEMCGENSKIIGKRKTPPNNNEENEEYDTDDDENVDRSQENEKKTGCEVDPISELFKVVQINTKHTCRSEIEKSYFKAEIFVQICCLCGTSEDIIQINDQLPYCQQCHLLPGKKRLMGKRNLNPDSRKKRKI